MRCICNAEEVFIMIADVLMYSMSSDGHVQKLLQNFSGCLLDNNYSENESKSRKWYCWWFQLFCFSRQ